MSLSKDYFRRSILLAAFLAVAAPAGTPLAEPGKRAAPAPVVLSAYDRIQYAADTGELTRKEAVLLTAELLFIPSLIPKDSKFALKAGDVLTREEGATGFYKDVHRVFAQLDAQERRFLRGLSPSLEAIISTKEQEEKAARKK
ncbi:MAG: hypothetical protein WC969_06115 [Elusimicrobiota bacterium]|jgi:hypothetical protein